MYKYVRTNTCNTCGLILAKKGGSELQDWEGEIWGRMYNMYGVHTNILTYIRTYIRTILKSVKIASATTLRRKTGVCF